MRTTPLGHWNEPRCLDLELPHSVLGTPRGKNHLRTIQSLAAKVGITEKSELPASNAHDYLTLAELTCK